MCLLLHGELQEIYLFHLKTQFVPRSKNAPSRLCTALFSKTTIISISFCICGGIIILIFIANFRRVVNVVYFSVIPRLLYFLCRSFGKLCLLHLHNSIKEEE